MVLKNATQENFPYTFARVSAMKSKIIGKDEYYKLLKMDLSTITRHLQDSQFKDSITKLSTEYRGVELIDMALRREQYRIFNKLREISPQLVIDVIDLYLMRYDYQNLKIILRGIYSNASKEEVFALIQPIGKYRKEYFMDLFETNSISKILKTTKIITCAKSKGIGCAYDSFKENNNIIELENELDKIYFNLAIKGAKELDNYGIQFKLFLLRQIDIVNLKNLLRFKKEKMDSNKILNYMIFEGKEINSNKIKKLANTDSLKSLITELKKTYYHKYIDFNETDEIFDIEMRLQKYLMKRVLIKSYRHPMSIESILSFMFLKIIEIKNLRSIIKSKHLGIDSDFVMKKLLILKD
jgi:V/A-type H+/Na+-transporting ATPase subunit C